MNSSSQGLARSRHSVCVCRMKRFLKEVKFGLSYRLNRIWNFFKGKIEKTCLWGGGEGE